jgi:hypothetical protein
MRFSFNERHEKMAKALTEKFFPELSLPTDCKSLKRAFRSEASKLHPDKGGSHGDFSRMKEVYDFLISSREFLSGVIFSPTKDSSPIATDGTPLSSLGLGLGPTVNGKECVKCGGLGYRERPMRKKVDCPRCNGFGEVPREFKCRPCSGTGTFKLKNGKTTQCNKCGGSGRFKHPRLKKVCPRCWGRRKLRVEVPSEKTYVKCGECGGSGETEMFNPVLPKGRLFFAKGA